MTIKGSLLIPVENQVRELDPKLLLACVAAQRGFTSILGSRREMHFNIGAFPPGIYLSKSVTAASEWMFDIMRHLGHGIIAWDEEALVHLPPDIYYSRRLSPTAMAAVAHFCAWGQDNVELWERYPQLPAGARLHATGNPRNDMLRPELQPFYDETVRAIQASHGKFILVNTNFNHVNAFSPVQNLFQPSSAPAEAPKTGRAAKGMPQAYAEGLQHLKQKVFEAFKQLIPKLDAAFPDHNIVVRPHPTESQEVYHQIAARCQRVKVTNEGNVVPWLMAAKALIHNGCTTGVEAFTMGVPAISYRATVDERYDLGFYRLPNLVSHQCFDWEQLRQTLSEILGGARGVLESDASRELVHHHMAALEGPLACERIVDILEQMAAPNDGARAPGFTQRFKGHCKVFLRNRVKKLKARLPGSHNRPSFQRHRYPEIPLADMTARLRRFEQLLGSKHPLVVEPFHQQFFTVRSGAAGDPH